MYFDRHFQDWLHETNRHEGDQIFSLKDLEAAFEAGFDKSDQEHAELDAGEDI